MHVSEGKKCACVSGSASADRQTYKDKRVLVSDLCW